MLRGLGICGAALLAQAPAWAAEPQGLSFGSYGRVVVATDGRGHGGVDADVVSHGSRLDEGNYLEIDLRYRLAPSGRVTTRLVSTLAIKGEPFHYDGGFDVEMAIRNLYIETRGVGTSALGLWAGSRMLRGDDIYLFDYWPLDNLNTLGAGATYDAGPWSFGLHAGASRLRTPFQFQVVDVPAPTYGAAQVVYLDRPRFVASARVDYAVGCRGTLCLRARLYGEAHTMPSGDVFRPTYLERWPADHGWVAGAELSAWRDHSADFVNLWVRAAGGLAAYGQMSVPYGFAPDRTVAAAQEIVVAASANVERGPVGLLAAAYARRFVDADPNRYDPDDRWEGIVAARPHWFWTQHTGIAIEGSWQFVRTSGLDPATGHTETATVSRIALVPFVNTQGRSVFSRPQLRAIVSVAVPNDAAQRLRPALDPRFGQPVEWFLGLGAEWWIESSYR